MAKRETESDLASITATGDRRASLEALRDHLARELENAPPGVAIGPIAKELRTIMAELDELPDAAEESALDQLAARRAARIAAAARASDSGVLDNRRL